MGFLVNFLSKPVISGFTSAAAIIIGLSQLKHLLGAPFETTNKIHLLIIEFFFPPVSPYLKALFVTEFLEVLFIQNSRSAAIVY